MSLSTTSSGVLCSVLDAPAICGSREAPVWPAVVAEHPVVDRLFLEAVFFLEVQADWKPIAQVFDLISEGKDIGAAVFKPQGYMRRLFSGESWTDWLEHRTDLGRVVRAFCDYTCNPAKPSADYLKYFRIDSDTLTRASAQAKSFLDNPPRPSVGLLERLNRATTFPPVVRAGWTPIVDDAKKAGSDIGGAVGKAFEDFREAAEETVRRAAEALRLKELAEKARQARNTAAKKHADALKGASKILVKSLKKVKMKAQQALDQAAEKARQAQEALEDARKAEKAVLKVKEAVENEARKAQAAARQGVNDIVDTARKAAEDTSGAMGQLKSELRKGYDAQKAAVSKLAEHHVGAMKGLVKIASGEHKLSIHSFEEARRKARRDYAEELKRAPAPVKVLHETVRYMVEEDPEGTAVLIASFAADAALPGAGQAIRVAYAAKKLHDSGVPPDQIVGQLAEGNAELLVKVAVDAYAPEFTGALEVASNAKKVHDTYKDNEEIIEAAMAGDGRALALVGQTVVLMNSEVGDQLEKHGVSPIDVIKLQEGDAGAATNLVSAGLRMSVEGMMTEQGSAQAGKPATGEKDAMHEIVVDEDGSQYRAADPETDRPVPGQRTGDSEAVQVGKKAGKKSFDRALDKSGEIIDDRAGKAQGKLDDHRKQRKKDLQQQRQKEFGKKAKAEGATKKELRHKRKLGKQVGTVEADVEYQVKSERIAAKAKKAKKAFASLNTLNKAYNLCDNPAGEVIEHIVEHVLKAPGWVAAGLAELLTSESLGKDPCYVANQGKAEACKEAGFDSCQAMSSHYCS